MTIMIEAVYADGWDGAVVNPMTRATAEARDAAGEPYAVLLLHAGRLRGLVHVSWRDGFCQVTGFNGQGCTVSRCEWRDTGEGDLFLYDKRTWDGPDDVSEYEFPHVAARHSTRQRLDGRHVDIDEPLGDRGARTETESIAPPQRLPRPGFGQWQELLAFAGTKVAVISDPEEHSLPVRESGKPPWRAPRPLPPGDVDELFVAGAEFIAANLPVRVELHRAGQLRMPSGRLVVADPSSLDIDERPYTVTVAPGTYPVTVSLVRFVDHPEHTRVAAARLEITDRPVASWEMALRAGQDLLALRYQNFWGFGVDAGMACFIDAQECSRLADAWRDLDGILEERFTTVEDGAMVAWLSGWGDGSYPTWIGRDSEGEVACFVADMTLFPRDGQGWEDEDADEDDDA